MQRSNIDIWVGLFVLIGAAALLFLALQSANLLSLNFQKTYARHGALRQHRRPQAARPRSRAPAWWSGASNRSRSTTRPSRPASTLALQNRYSFPKDSSLKILTSGLLGEQYIGIEAGADEKNLASRRYDHRHPVGGRAGEPDQPVPLQQGGRRQQPTRRQRLQQEMKPRILHPERSLSTPLLRLAGAGGCCAGHRCARLRHRPNAQSGRSVRAVQPRRLRASTMPSTTPCCGRSPPPIARSLPSLVRTGVNNFFGNLGDVWNFANSVAAAQGCRTAPRPSCALTSTPSSGSAACSTSRPKPASTAIREDFGQTLGRWGVPSGSVCRAAVARASTLRDTAALPVDRQGDLLRQVDDVPVRNSLYVLRVVDLRANLPARRPAARTTRRSTNTPSPAMPTCSAAATTSTTAIAPDDEAAQTDGGCGGLHPVASRRRGSGTAGNRFQPSQALDRPSCIASIPTVHRIIES